MPEPVPPATEWVMTKPSSESDPSASLSIISMICSWHFSPSSYPTQLHICQSKSQLSTYLYPSCFLLHLHAQRHRSFLDYTALNTNQSKWSWLLSAPDLLARLAVYNVHHPPSRRIHLFCHLPKLHTPPIYLLCWFHVQYKVVSRTRHQLSNVKFSIWKGKEEWLTLISTLANLQCNDFSWHDTIFTVFCCLRAYKFNLL